AFQQPLSPARPAPQPADGRTTMRSCSQQQMPRHRATPAVFCDRTARALTVMACAALLAGCGSTSKPRGGGYYKDDGPGSDIPANILSIPDAVPRIETYARANNRP